MSFPPPLHIQDLPARRPFAPRSHLQLTVSLLLLFCLAGCSLRPQPYTREEFLNQARQAKTALFGNQEPVAEKVTLHEAMARAVRYNVEHRVRLLQKALADGSLKAGHFDLLPQLVASAGYSARSNQSGSSSKSLLSGAESLEPSTSEEKNRFTAEIIHVWNILDFGLAYTRAQQAADELLISEEGRRKTVQNIIQDVRYAFWRATSAELLLPEMDELLRRVESALVRSRQMEELRAQAPIKTLAYQQELLETVRQLWEMRRQLSLAKTELAALMNLEPGSWYQIGLPDEQPVYPAHLLSPEALEEQALSRRPELHIEAYQKRISGLEIRRALLERLPGLQFSLGANYDDNTYLYNNSWLQAGLNLSWNVLGLLSGPAQYQRAKLQQEVADQRYTAVAMMVLTQVHLAQQRYELARKEYQIAEQLAQVHRRKLWHVEAARKAQTGSELEEIRLRLGALSAQMRQGLAFAELQSALGRIFHSCGVDPLPRMTETMDLQELTAAIASHEAAVLLAFQTERTEPAGRASFFDNLQEQKRSIAAVPAPTVGGPAATETTEEGVVPDPSGPSRDRAQNQQNAAPPVASKVLPAEPEPPPGKSAAVREAAVGQSSGLAPPGGEAPLESRTSRQMQLGKLLSGVEPEPFRIPLVSVPTGQPQLAIRSPQGLSYRTSEGAETVPPLNR